MRWMFLLSRFIVPWKFGRQGECAACGRPDISDSLAWCGSGPGAWHHGMLEHPNFQLWTLGRLNVLKTIDQLRPRSVDAGPVPARSGGQRGRLTRTGTESTWTVVDAVCRCVW